MRDTTFIYCLCEPGTKTIRYFGKADNPRKRLAGHLKYSKVGKRVPVTCWITKLLKAGHRPALHVLREIPQSDWKTYERAFIAVGRQHGLALLNLSDGGDGFESGPTNPAHKWKGKKLPADWVSKSAAARTGVKLSPAHRAAIAAARTGKKASLETRLKMREDRKGLHQGLKRPGASSPFLGVSWDKAAPLKNPWRAQVNDNGKRCCLGFFSTEYTAALAYDKAVLRIYGAKAKLNFPDGQ